MRCPKCNGAMTTEKFYDEFGDSFEGYRCINCGQITDPVILQNNPQKAVLRTIHDLDTMMELEMKGE